MCQAEVHQIQATYNHLLFFIFRFHSYDTNVERGKPAHSEVLSQESSQPSQDPSLESNEESSIHTDCRLCSDPICLDSVEKYISCTKPDGTVHYAANFSCLGLYPFNSVDRKLLRSKYCCPLHVEEE